METARKLKFVALCLIGTAINASAQLKIHSNGNMSLHNPDTTALSPVSLNCSGDSLYFLHYSGAKNGVYSFCHDDSRQWNIGGHFASELPSLCNAVGVKGEVLNNFDTFDFEAARGMRSYGVMGIAGYGWEGYNFGVFGRVDGLRDGSAIYGTTRQNSFGYGFDGKWAGFFDGDVGINGNVEQNGDYTIDGCINGIVLDDLYEHLYGERRQPRLDTVEPVSVRLDGMSAIPYTYSNSARLTSAESDGVVPNTIARQRKDKIKYSLPAELMEKEFPELVYERTDGRKAVDYIGMVPLLVQAINELKAEIDILKGKDSADDVGAGPVPARNASKSGTTAIVGTPATTRAVLYQNTPNPFTAQTEIRFSLPDNASSAYIYIFDMQGKMQKQIPVNPDQQSVTLNGYELQAGVYLYSLVVGGKEIDTKRMILSK